MPEAYQAIAARKDAAVDGQLGGVADLFQAGGVEIAVRQIQLHRVGEERGVEAALFLLGVPRGLPVNMDRQRNFLQAQLAARRNEPQPCRRLDPLALDDHTAYRVAGQQPRAILGRAVPAYKEIIHQNANSSSM